MLNIMVAEEGLRRKEVSLNMTLKEFRYEMAEELKIPADQFTLTFGSFGERFYRDGPHDNLLLREFPDNVVHIVPNFETSNIKPAKRG